MRSFSKARLSFVTASAMTIATFPIIAFSVLASELIEEFGLARAQIGFLVTATGLVGALSSPMFGRITDRIGAYRSTRGVLAVGAVTLTATAFSPSYALLLVAALTTGLANGWSNPATNTLIVDNVEAGTRGFVTGLKQSGVQIGTFLGGLLLPLLTDLFNWRVALVAFTLIPLAGLVGMARRSSQSRSTQVDVGRGPSGAVPASVRWVAIYGAVSGFSTSAMFGFLPLFAEEDQLWSAASAGALVSVVGLVGIGARIGWPVVAERRMGHGVTLRLLALLTCAGAVLLWAASLGAAASWVLLPAAVLLGGGAIAWNAVGMLAVMDFSPAHMVGKSTGLVLLGFLLGIASGAPVMGWSVDTFSTYSIGFGVITALLALDAVIAGRIPARSPVSAS